MSDAIVLKKQCERCPAVDEVPVSAEDIKSGKYVPEKNDGPPKFEIKVAGKVVASYKRLCAACDAAITKQVTDISKKREKKTSTRS